MLETLDIEAVGRLGHRRTRRLLRRFRFVAFNYFNPWSANIGTFGGNLNTDTFKLALLAPGSPTPPTTNDSTFNTSTGALNSSGALEIANGNGYTTGGATIGSTSYTQSGGTATLAGTPASPTWTSTGAFANFRYVLCYDATAGSSTARYAIGWWDYGSTVTLGNTNTFTVTLASGIFTLAHA